MKENDCYRYNFDAAEDEIGLDELHQLILPDFRFDMSIMKRLAIAKRDLFNLTRNLETEADIADAKDQLFFLQDWIDSIASEYALSCIDNFIFG